MNVQQLIVLLPCHSLEDFPQHHRGEDASALLAAWTSMWHPALLAAANRAPVWHRASDPPAQVEHSLVVAPSVCAAEIPTDWADRIRQSQSVFITGAGDRDALVEQLLSCLDERQRSVDPELARDFLALGYAFLQIQILTRQMRYSSSLDEVNFNRQLLAAAQATAAGNLEEARAKLSACFGLLAEERDHFYAVDAFLLDLTLVAPTTLGSSLREELDQPSPVNLLLNGESLARMADEHSGTIEALKAALTESRASIVGVEQRELCLPLLSFETILNELRRGLETCRSLLDRRPVVYGRRRFGITPALPTILDRLGYRGACHVSLDDGRFPQGSQIKTRWEGLDGVTIDSLSKAPLDARKAETFLALGTRLGESMDMDNVATLWLAHWPGAAHFGYGDLRRCARYCAAMGRFLTLDAYFRDTYAPGHLDRFDTDQYLSPYLNQSVQRQSAVPISSVMEYWKSRTALEQSLALDVMLAALGGPPSSDLADLERDVDRTADEGLSDESSDRVQRELQTRLDRFASTLPSSGARGPQGCLVVNPRNFARRIAVDLPLLEKAPKAGRPIYAAGRDGRGVHALVDVPAMGFVWVGEGTSENASSGPLLAEDRSQDEGVWILRNEYFEVRIHPGTGAIASIKNYESRTNRMSAQIAYRKAGARSHLSYADVSEQPEYSGMVAEQVRIVRATTAAGEIEAAGHLVDRNGSRLAEYRQLIGLCRGKRVVQIDVELNPIVEPSNDAWRSYYGYRFAWPDEDAVLSRSLNQTQRKAGGQRIEAPHYVEVRSGESRTCILTGGLPYHRRSGPRMLDSLLIVHGERARKFRLGIGLDLTHPMQEAIGLLSPPALARVDSAPKTAGGWFIHLDAKNLVVTHWSVVVEEGRACGFRARILETGGRSARAKLSCCREIVRARYVGFQGNTLGECILEDGRAVLDMTAHQWSEVEVFWS